MAIGIIRNIGGGTSRVKVFKNFVQNCALTSSKPNGRGSGYTINTSTQLTKSDSGVRSYTTSTSGYCNTIMSPVPIDVTKYGQLVFTVNVSTIKSSQFIQCGIADNTNDGFTYVSATTQQGDTTGTKIISVDISQAIGLKYLFVWLYTAQEGTMDFTITDIETYRMN